MGSSNIGQPPFGFPGRMRRGQFDRETSALLSGSCRLFVNFCASMPVMNSRLPTRWEVGNDSRPAYRYPILITIWRFVGHGRCRTQGGQLVLLARAQPSRLPECANLAVVVTAVKGRLPGFGWLCLGLLALAVARA